MKKILLGILLLSIATFTFAQQWGMYTIYGAQNNTTTYLLDTAGTTFHTWTHSSTDKNGYSCYVLEGDTLLRSAQNSGNDFNGGGIHGTVQKVTWDGDVVWDFTYSTYENVIHHDICGLPNGNVLMICYDRKTSSESTQAGCDESIEIWSEKIMEVRPTGATTGEIVWEWYLWDHLCQDYSSSKDNYVSSISDNPQLFHINYNPQEELLHMNGIDYNAELDQIAFTSRFSNEFYVIDHSTTTAEATGHTGGNSGMGGDLLYRWGNPAVYEESGTQVFNTVHDVHWISADHPEFANNFAVLNNQGGSGGKAACDVINPPYDGYNYTHTASQAYLPSTYTHRVETGKTSQGQGSTEQLENGNMLLCVPSMSLTYIYEIDSDGNTLWTKNITGNVAQAHRYEKCHVRGVSASITPSEAAITEGESTDLNTTVLAPAESSPTYTYNWSSSPEGYTGTSASPTVSPLETTTYYLTVTNDQSECADEVFVIITVDPVSVELNTLEDEISIFPNPNDGLFRISATDDFSYTVLTSTGSQICSGRNNTEIDLSHMSEGVYYVVIETANFVKTEKLIIIK